MKPIFLAAFFFVGVPAAIAAPGFVDGGFGDANGEVFECEFSLAAPKDVSSSADKIADAFVYFNENEIYWMTGKERVLQTLGLKKGDISDSPKEHLKMRYENGSLSVLRDGETVIKFPLLLPPKAILAYQHVIAEIEQFNLHTFIPNSSTGLTAKFLERLPLGLILKEDMSQRIFLTINNRGEIQLFELGVDIREENLSDFERRYCPDKVLAETGWWCRFKVLGAMSQP